MTCRVVMVEVVVPTAVMVDMEAVCAAEDENEDALLEEEALWVEEALLEALWVALLVALFEAVVVVDDMMTSKAAMVEATNAYDDSSAIPASVIVGDLSGCEGSGISSTASKSMDSFVIGSIVVCREETVARIRNRFTKAGKQLKSIFYYYSIHSV